MLDGFVGGCCFVWFVWGLFVAMKLLGFFCMVDMVWCSPLVKFEVCVCCFGFVDFVAISVTCVGTTVFKLLLLWGLH